MSTQTAVRQRNSAQIHPTNNNTNNVQSFPIANDKGYPTNGVLTKGAKLFTWEEVAQHNTAESAWVYSGNKVYDITQWLDRHPGGRDVLLLVAGRDITDLLVTYHPFSENPTQVIKKYEIGEIAISEFPQYKPDSGFYKDIRQEVGDYFKKNQLNPKNPIPGLQRLASFLTLALVCWYICGSSNVWFGFRILAALFFGVLQALPLLHSMHDSSHTSSGPSPVYWSVLGRLTMDWFAGACLYSWLNQHTIGHHVYTNVMGVDPDLPMKRNGDPRRVAPYQTWLPLYKFQHIYLLVLYGILALKFRIQDITDTLMDETNGALRVNSRGKKEIIGQVVTKTFWAFWRIFVPLYFWRVSISDFLILFLISEWMTGYFLTFNFQVSHVSPPADFPDLYSPLNDEWAVSQVRTSIDYGHDSWMTNLLCGALNYQTVHHLLPSVSQYHYPAIAPIVQKVCKKYGVTYNYVPSFWTAFGMHVQHLKNMGMEAIHRH